MGSLSGKEFRTTVKVIEPKPDLSTWALVETDLGTQPQLPAEREGFVVLPDRTAGFSGPRGREADVTEVLALEALLDLPDNELMDLLLARKDPQGALDNNAVRSLLKRMRTT